MSIQNELINISIFISMALAIWFIAWLIARKIFVPVIHQFIKKTKYNWDDVLSDNKVFARLAHAVPAIALYKYTEVYAKSISVKDLTQVANEIANSPVGEIASNAAGNVSEILMQIINFTSGFSQIYLIFAILFAADAFLNAIVALYRRLDFSHKMPIKGFLQVAKIFLWAIAIILSLSIIMGKSPGYFLTGLGAMTAILMLIFKDSILGLVAGIQLSTNKMLRVGDWVEMPKFGADGDVIDISLATVKIRNWDKTITTIPTYAMVSDSFKNWRGMSESGGRRIKRSINIDMNSVKLCDENMLARFKRFQYISAYIGRKTEEVAEYNAKNNVNSRELVNGRRLTNLGTFRAYLEAYLNNHKMINKDLTFLIRHLQPTEKGLPIEIYIFSSEKRWVNYEGIQADIFDHILAVIPEFELKVFQNPTGSDFANFAIK